MWIRDDEIGNIYDTNTHEQSDFLSLSLSRFPSLYLSVGVHIVKVSEVAGLLTVR